MIRRRAKHWMNGHLLTSTQPRRAKKWTLAIIFFQNSSTNSYTNRPVLLLSDPRKCAGSCTKANLLRSANVWKLHELAILLFSTQTQLKAISIIFQIQVPPVCSSVLITVPTCDCISFWGSCCWNKLIYSLLSGCLVTFRCLSRSLHFSRTQSMVWKSS